MSLWNHFEVEQQKPEHSTNITVKCFPGCTFMRMGEKIIHRRLNIMGYDHIIYHLGTNDIVTYDMEEIQDSVLELNHISRLFNKKANIILSLPLPRPRDLQQTWPKQEILNHWLFQIKKDYNITTWRSYKPFLQKRDLDVEKVETRYEGLFRRDGIHLSEVGTDVLVQQFKMAVSYIC